MISFVKGIFFDQVNRGKKMLSELRSPDIHAGVDRDFLAKTIRMLEDFCGDIEKLIHSGDLDVESLAPNNIIKYNTFHETLLKIELFRFLVIVNYDAPEEYFKKKVQRIYAEIDCFQKTPIVTTISNSENYYWALPAYDIIAVPSGEEKNLLNLPDLFHEMGHLIFNQYERYLKGNIDKQVSDFFKAEITLVLLEQRPKSLVKFFTEKREFWLGSWVMEFTCDFIATYLVGPAYGWTNLKLTTLSCGKSSIFQDYASHPSDESRMRAIFYMLEKTGHSSDVKSLQLSWQKFLGATKNVKPHNYAYIFPQQMIESLGDAVLTGCKAIGLKSYSDQVRDHKRPVSLLLNEAWATIMRSPNGFLKWESDTIQELKQSLSGVNLQV